MPSVIAIPLSIGSATTMYRAAVRRTQVFILAPNRILYLRLAALGEQGAQTSDLRLRRVGALVCRLLSRRHQTAVGTEEPEPVVLSLLHGLHRDAVPEAHRRPELIAPEPAVLIGLDRLVEPARQAKSLQLPRLRLVEEVLRRAEDPGVEIALLGAVLLRGRWREHLEDDVRQASALFPGDPDLALAVRVDAPHPEDVRASESLLGQPFRLLLRDLPCLLHGVVHEHVHAGVEVGAALLG